MWGECVGVCVEVCMYVGGSVCVWEVCVCVGSVCE